MEISDKSFRTSAVKLSTKNAWSHYASRRWPQNTVKAVMMEWDLTDGEARGLVYGQASQPTIDKILDHPRGGFALGLLILEIRTQTALRDWIHTEQERSAHEAERHARNAAALREMACRLPAAAGVGAVRPRVNGVRESGERRANDR